MRITHLGHACLLVEIADATLVLDPGCFSNLDPVAAVDAILLTHAHPDHLDIERVKRLVTANPQAVVHGDPGSVKALSAERISARETVADESFEIAGAHITPMGAEHAEILPYIPRITNVGLLITAPGQRRLFHPGDAFDARPDGVDLLAVPINAPWQASKEMVAWVREVQPARVIPIHDALLSDIGRSGYLRQLGEFGLDGGVEVCDLAGVGTVEF